jgi:hypothetical protein
MAPKKKKPPPSASTTLSAGGRDPPHPRGRQDGPDQNDRSEAQSRQDQSAAESVLVSSVPQQQRRFSDSESKLVEDMAMALKRKYGQVTPEIASEFLLRGFGITPISDAVGQSAAADVTITGSSRAARAPAVSPSADESEIAVTAKNFIKGSLHIRSHGDRLHVVSLARRQFPGLRGPPHATAPDRPAGLRAEPGNVKLRPWRDRTGRWKSHSGCPRRQCLRPYPQPDSGSQRCAGQHRV